MVRFLLALLLMVSGGMFAQEPIDTAQLQILGAALSVGPAQQTVPLQTPTVVHTLLGSPGSPIAVDASYVVKGELSGPQLPSPVTLTTHPNDDFQIPGLNLPGDYVLSDIRLEKDGRFISYAEPSRVGFLVKQILVTTVTSRPLTLEEIQARGIVIDASSYKVVELAIGLKLESGTYDITFPIVWTAEGPQIIASGVGGGWGTTQPGVKPPKFNPPQIAPFNLQVEWPAGEEDKPKPAVSIPGIIVIPTDIAFLHQFFSVMLMATNDAPEGDPLVIRDLFAKLELPSGGGLREAQTNPPVPLGTFIPVKDPGPDEKLGTADDLTIIVAQATGKAEWNVEGLKEGNHIVNIRLEGTLEGLPVGPVPIKSKTQGMVIVRDPQFAFNVSHPGVVRKDEEYDAYLTITNTSNTAANLLSVSIPQNQIVGSTLLDLEGPEGSQRPDSSTILIQTLAAHESASVRLHLLATQTGQVTATAVRATSGTASISLTLGVGERGVPLSPTSLVFPAFIDRLPAGLTRYAIDLMGLGYSLATAPPGSVSADLPLTSESVIQKRGWELALAARYAQMGIDPFDAVAGFTLDWLGNREQDYGFDELRRTTAKGRRLNREIQAVIENHLAGTGNGFGDLLSDLHAFQCQASPFIAVLLRGNPSAAALGIFNRDTGRVSSGAYGEVGYRREVAHAEIFRLEDGSDKAQLAILGAPYHWEGDQTVPYAYEVQVVGRPGADSGGQNVSLSILRGDADGSFEILDYGTITVYPTPMPFALAPVSIAGAGAAAVMAGGIWTTVNPGASPVECPAFNALAVVQDPYADPIGRAVVVVFNQRPAITGDPDADLARITLEAHIDRAEVPIHDLVRDLYDVKLQGDGRTAILSFKSPISPWSTNTLVMTGLDPAAPDDQFQHPVTRSAEFQTAGAIVGGQVIGPDGQPVPNAPVELWETDHSDLDGGSFTHVTAVTTTNAEGYYIFDYVRSKDPCLLRGYDPASGESGDVGYKTTNQAFHWLNIVMLARGNIRGTVKYPDGTLPEMARVIATSGVFGEHRTVGVNPATGEYSLSRLPVGNIALTAQDSLGNTFYANAYIAYGGQIVVKDIVLNKKADPGVGAVRGHVYYADSTPVGGTWVGVYAAEGGGERLLGSGTTDATGQFGFQNVPEGAVYLKAYDPRTQKVGGTVAVTVVRDATLTADIVISDLFGAITGRITHRDGAEPVAGCIVYLYNSAWVTSTDADGGFRFDELPLGSYLVEAIYPPERERGSKNVALSAPGEEGRVLIDISNSTGGITGTVKNSAGTPAANATVSIVVGGYPARVTGTNASGEYAFTDLPAGTYELQAYTSPVNAGAVEAGIRYNGEMAQADIVLSGSRMIEVNTQMSTGVEGEYAWVISPFKHRSRIVNEYGVIEWMDEYVSGGSTNGTSTGVTFGPIMAGPVQIIAGDPSFGQKSVQVTLKSSDPDPYPLTVTLDALCMLRGTVVSWTDGVTPVDDRPVSVIFKGADGLDRPVTTTDGTFKFPLVPKGGFTLEASDGLHRGFARGSFAFAGQILEGMEIRLLRVGSVQVEVLAPADGAHPAPWAVAGAVVSLHETHEPHQTPPPQTTMDDPPSATFNNINEGGFSVTATWLDVQGGATHTIAGRAVGRVNEEGEIVPVQVYLGGFAQLHGRVISPETYDPVQYCQVRLFRSPGTDTYDYTTSDDQGRFQFAYLPLGTYGVAALDPASGRSGRASGIVLDAQDEDPNIEILLESRGEVAGDVLYPDHLTVSPFATVKLVSRGLQPFSTLTSADIDGRFSFVGISRGPFDLYATALDSPRQGRASDELYTEGEVREVDIILQAAGRVMGRITRWDGTSIGDSTVHKTEFSQKMLSGGFWKAQQGGTIFDYDEVLVGKMFTLTADELVYPFHLGVATGMVDQEGQVVDLDVKLYPIGDVEVYVQTADGSPAGEVEVSLNSSGPYKDFKGYTDTYDKCKAVGGLDVCYKYQCWDDIGYGDFTVTARKWIAGSGSYLRGSGHGRVETDGGLATVTITLEATGSVVGTVFLPDGSTPAAGAHVYIHSGSRTLYFRTNADGWFVDGDNNPALGYQSVPTGSFWLEVIQDQGTGYYRLDGQSMSTTGVQYTVENGNPIILDGDALQVVAFLPAPGATQAETDASQVQIVVEFNDEIRAGYLNSTYFKLKKGTLAVSLASVGYVLEDGIPVTRKVRLVPAQNLASASVYTIEVSKDVKEDSGKTLGVTLYSSFTTKDSAPPAVIAIEPPADPECRHPLASGDLVTVVLTCSEPLDPSGVNAQTVSVSLDGVGPLSGFYGLEVDNTRIRFTATETLREDARYTVTVLGLRDAAGNLQTQAGVYKFCTRDSDGPAVAIVLDPKIQDNKVIEGQTYTLTADVGGATDIERVEWSINGGAPTSKTTPPFAFPFTAPSPEAASTLTILARAVDYSGNAGTADAALTVIANAPPVIADFSVDKAGQEVHAGDTVKAAAWIYDDVKLVKATLLVSVTDGVEVARLDQTMSACNNPASPCKASFTYTIPPGAVPGVWEFKVVALDSLDNSSESGVLAVTIPFPDDMGIPTVAFQCPTDGAILPGGYLPIITVHAAVPENSALELGLEHLALYREDALVEERPLQAARFAELTYQEVIPLPDAASPDNRRKYKAVVRANNSKSREEEIFVTSVDGDRPVNGADLSNFVGDQSTVIIENGNTAYMCADPKTCKFKNVVVLSGGVLSHYGTTANATMTMDFTAEKVYVECGGIIDASGKGYLPRQTYPNVQAHPVSYSAAGSHGGEGGRTSETDDQPMPVYGSIVNPEDPGSGTGYNTGGAGGGVIRAVVGALIVDGAIAADDTPGVQNPGAGGTINLSVGLISGGGSIHATGGTVENNNGTNSGGGGRVAIHYAQNRLLRQAGADQVTATAGAYSVNSGLHPGGAGTVYWFQDGFGVYGTLLVDNSGTKNSIVPRPTILPSVGTGTIGSFQWLNGDPSCGKAVMTAAAAFPWSLEGHYVRVYQDDGATELATYRIIENGSADMVSDSLVLEVPEGAGLQALEGKPYRGVLKLDAFDVRGNALLQTPDLIEVHGDLTMQGSGRIDADVEVFGSVEFVNSVAIPKSDETKTLNGRWKVHHDLTVSDHTVLTHTAATTAAEYKLDLDVDGILTVAENGKINVDGKGYLPRRTYPNVVAYPVGYFIGGSYGGYGGKENTLTTPHMPVYGSFIHPAEVGSGYGNDVGVGGGAVRVRAGALSIEGEIRSDGTGAGNPGSGGSVNLDVGALEGSGGIHANGGPGGSNSGGGGRVAIRYLVNGLDAGAKVEAKGGMNASGATGTGGAGTVYWFNTGGSVHGDLVVDNTGVTNPANSQSTPLPSVGSGAVLGIIGNVVVCQSDAAGWTAFPHSVVGLWLRLFDGEDIVGTYKILAQDANTLTVEGLPSISDPTILRYRGVVRLDSLTVAGGAYLLSDDIIETGDALGRDTLLNTGASVTVEGDLSLTGVTGRIRELTVTGNLTLAGGTTLTTPAPSPRAFYPMTLNVGGTLTIEANAALDVSGKGYVQQYTHPGIRKYWGASGATDGTGGGHGGLAGGDEAEVLVLATSGANGWGRAVMDAEIGDPMTVEFDFKLNRYYGGDGLVFMFYKKTDYTPQSGNSLAFGGGTDSPGYGLEINTEGDAALSGAHVALVKDRTANHLAVNSNVGDLDDGRWHHVDLAIGADGVQCRIDGSEVIAWDGILETGHKGLGFTASAYKASVAWDNWHFVDNLRISAGAGPTLVLEDDFSRPSDLWRSFEGKTYRNDRVVYGDVMNPSAPGSGGSGTSDQRGGGVIAITAGRLIHNGLIRADGLSAGGISGGGGSILVKTLAGLDGAGRIQAVGGDAYGPGSGGRIALHGPVAMGGSQLSARGGKNSHAAGALSGNSDGAPGTLYFGDGDRLVVDATNTTDTTPYPNATPMPRIGSGGIVAVSQEAGAPLQWFKVGGDGITVPMSQYASAASSAEITGGANSAANTIDGQALTYWLLPLNTQGYVYMDLGGIYPLTSIQWRNTAKWNYRTNEFHISIAQNPDFSDAQVVKSGSMPNADNPETQTLTMPEPLPLTRFVIFYVDSWYGSGGGLDELQVIVKANPFALATPHLFPGGYIYFNGDPSVKYAVVGNDPLDHAKIFVEKGTNPDLTTFLTPGTPTFKGLYQFNAVDVIGGAQLYFQDELECPGCSPPVGPNVLMAPNYPPLTTTITSPSPGPLNPGQNLAITVTASGRAMKSMVLTGSGAFSLVDPRPVLGTQTAETFQVTVPAEATSGSVTFRAVITDTLNQEFTTADLTFAIETSLNPPLIHVVQPPADQREAVEGDLFTVTVEAVPQSGAEGIDRVAITYADQTYTCAAPPYSATFRAVDVPATVSMPVAIEAVDTLGVAGTAAFDITIIARTDGVGPQVILATECLTPLYCRDCTLPVPITATDDQAISRIEVLREGIELVAAVTDVGSASYSGTIGVPMTALGAQIFTVRVLDYGDNSVTSDFPMEIVTGVLFDASSGDALISEDDTLYETQSLFVREVTLTADGAHAFGDVVLLDGAVLTHSDTGPSAEYRMELHVNRLHVGCDARVDVSGMGYDPGFTHPNTMVGGAVGTAAGSHGGVGGHDIGAGAPAAFGSVFFPSTPGGGGGPSGTSGGGVVVIDALQGITVRGEISADGLSASGSAGAGGSILLMGPNIRVTGTIHARGGDGDRSGAGGRIAVHYTTDLTGDLRSRLSARQGKQASYTQQWVGGTGTIFLNHTGGASDRRLFINPENEIDWKSNPSVIPSIGEGTTDAGSFQFVDVQTAEVTITGAAFPWSVEGHYLRVFTGPDAADYTDFEVLRGQDPATSSSTLRVRVPDGVTDLSPYQSKRYRGVVKLEELSLMDCQYGRLASSDLVEIQGDLAWTDVCGYLDAELRVMGNLTVTDCDWLEWNRPVRAEGNLTLDYSYILSQYEPDSADAISRLELESGGRLTLGTGSYLDASHGYAPGMTYPGVPITGSYGTSSSGSHGGVGGVQAGDAEVPTYGSFVEPMEAGSGGGGSGAWGGGVIRLNAGELYVNGNLYARGDYGSNSAGSGGSILIEAGDLALNGNVYATGNTPTNGPGSGGGRIAVYYRRNVGSALWRDWLYAGGGCKGTYTSDQMGGAGTVFIFNTSETEGSVFGELILNQSYGNPYQIGTRPTVLPSVGTGFTAAGALTWVDPASRTAVFTVPGADFPWNLGGLYLRIYLADDGSAWTDFPILGPVSSAAAGDAFYIEVPAGVDVLDPYNENHMYQGIVKLDSLTVRNGSVLRTDDLLEVSGSVVVDTGGEIQADMMKDGALTIDGYIKERSLPWIVPGDLRLINGAVLTHPATDASEEHKLILRVAGALEIDAASRIDVSSKGYRPGIGYGNTADTGTVGSQASGSHGGMGGIMTEADAAGATYGSPFNPVDSGAGAGAVNAGGGVVWIEADRVVAAGDILADGEGAAGSANGGGAGGSIRIRTREVQITGVLSASGGPGITTGGGGRIAVVYETNPGDGVEQHCRVWTGAHTNWDETHMGSAGTVFLFNTASASGSVHGRLIVDAGPDNGASWIHGTVLPGVGEGTTGFGAMVVEDASGRVVRFTIPGAAFPWSLEGLHLRIFTVADRAVFTDFPILGNATTDPFSDTLLIHVPETVEISDLSLYDEKPYQGILKLDDFVMENWSFVSASDPLELSGDLAWAHGTGGLIQGPAVRVPGDVVMTNGCDFYTAAPLHVAGDVILDGGYMDATKIEAEGSVLLRNEAAMYILYTPMCAQEPYPLEITAHTAFEMDAGSTLYGDWYGYCGGLTYGAIAEGASTGGSGGSHGGWGGLAPGGAVGTAYGSFHAPRAPGAGQGTDGGASGGGVLSIHSPRVVVDGLIEVDGYRGSAAGSILIEAGTVEVGGAITANGGDSPTAGAPSGGGGRIAIYYGQDLTATGSLADTLQARGGVTSAAEGTAVGGAGTVYLFDTDDSSDGTASAYGDLIVDNTGASTLALAGQPTPVTPIGTGAVGAFAPTDDPAVWAMVKSDVNGFPFSPEGGTIEFTGTWVAGPYVVLGLDSADPRVLYFRIDDASSPPETATGTGYSGSYRLDSITVRGGARLVFSDPLYDCPNISITVDTTSISDLTAPNYSVSGGGCQ